VLSFTLESGPDQLEGEVIVSAETAIHTAASYGWPATDELLLYVVHGTLHLAGCLDAVDGRLFSFDAWTGRHVMVNVQNAYAQDDCPCCKGGGYEYLEGKAAGRTITLCGRDAVQVYPGRSATIDLAALADRLQPVAHERPRFNPLLLKAQVESYELTVFADGRAIIKGTSKPEEARAVYARYLGG